MTRLKFLSLIIFFVASFNVQGNLELDKIMAGNDFIGHQPYAVNWSPSSEEIYFKWKSY